MQKNVPKEYLPPKEYSPEYIVTLPELARWSARRTLNLGWFSLIRHIEEGRGDKVAVLDGDRKFTWNELLKEVAITANALKELGIEEGSGDRVAIKLDNIAEFIIANFACWMMNCVPVLMMPLLGVPEMTYILQNSEAKAIIAGARFTEDIDKLKSKVETIPKDNYIIVGGERDGWLKWEDWRKGKSDKIQPYPDTDPMDVAMLIYTSGTTGLPKGVIHTHWDLGPAALCHAKYVLGLNPDCVGGGHPTFGFFFGYFNIICEGGATGAAMSCIGPRRKSIEEDMFEVIEKHRITHIYAVPPVFKAMVESDKSEEYDLSSLKLAQSSAMYLPPETRKRWVEKFKVPILDSLGQSEVGYLLTTFVDTPPEKFAATGFPVPGYEARVVDPTTMEPVPTGEAGELIIRGPTGYRYWRRPEKMQESIWNGWSRAGLLYRRDEDGYYYYISRTDDVIITAGYKFPATDVEQVLEKHPAVQEVAVVASPHPERENVVKAYIVLKEGYKPSMELAKELQEFTKKSVAPYKYPRRIEFVKSLPRTPTGKIAGGTLRKWEREKYGEKGEKPTPDIILGE